jgi:hypothetical protein
MYINFIYFSLFLVFLNTEKWTKFKKLTLEDLIFVNNNCNIIPGIIVHSDFLKPQGMLNMVFTWFSW